MSASGLCPRCGTPRIGYFRWCRNCRLDFDALEAGTAPAETRLVSAPPVSAPPPAPAAGQAPAVSAQPPAPAAIHAPPTGAPSALSAPAAAPGISQAPPLSAPAAAPGISQAPPLSAPAAAPGIGQAPRVEQPAIAPTPVTGSRRGWIVLGAVTLVAIVGLFGFLGISSSDVFTSHHKISGTLTLLNSDTNSPSVTSTGAVCQGAGPYGDIAAGNGVALKDADGKLLAITSLGVGSGSPTSCVFGFTLKDVPEVPFYSIEVGRRGQVGYTLADMKSNDWTLALRMGK